MIQEKTDPLSAVAFELNMVRKRIERLEKRNAALKRLALAVNDYFQTHPNDDNLQEVVTNMKNALDACREVPRPFTKMADERKFRLVPSNPLRKI